MTKLYQTSAVATGGREGHVRSEDGIIDMDLRTPPSMGGAGGATTPEDLFAAGWAACFNGALDLAIRMNRVKAGTTSVKAAITLGKLDTGEFQLSAEIEATVPGVAPEEALRLAGQAHTICPYSRATRGDIEVRLSVKTS